MQALDGVIAPNDITARPCGGVKRGLYPPIKVVGEQRLLAVFVRHFTSFEESEDEGDQSRQLLGIMTLSNSNVHAKRTCFAGKSGPIYAYRESGRIV